MSTTASNQSELQDHFDTDECEYCGEEFAIIAAVEGNYCSTGCFYREKGERVLNQIKSDHRICATCFRRIKEVEYPPGDISVAVPTPDPPHGDGDTDGVKDVLIGYQYPTPSTEFAIDDTSTDAYRVQERRRWSCECGTVDPSERDDILEDVEIEAIVPNLLQTLRFLERSGAIQQRPQKDRLFEALREEWRDWAFAIGRALYD